ncbi:MAG: YggS family pyridoxal phosphate-dependent enzyme [Alphaproteobacteria bacterium]|nr:YggS family pyridoxal phosphate-dependent enzyme [Alphaproteobacteria bacterium]OJV46462.1 MAG: YggS family pyridoxal phosphate enzyme [Alphaproteobacteria bacterium 43-37]
MKALDRYYDILETITRAAQKYKRHVELMVVTKSASMDEIEPIMQAGCLLFGENRLQDILKKWLPNTLAHHHHQLHFIGQIQSNKLSTIMEKCDGILSLSKLKHIDLIHTMATPPKRFFAQVNIGYEPQKGGLAPEDLKAFIEYAHGHSIMIEGLAAIPPAHEDPGPYFMHLKALGEKFCLPSLSMGMSDDYLTAIKAGATMVRVGRAIFEK